MIENGFVVESTITRSDGATGTARVYVGTRERALELVEQGRVAGTVRTFRELPLAEMPEAASENLRRARAEASAH